MPKNLTKRQIAKAEKIIERLGVGIEVSLDSYIKCEVEAKDRASENFHSGSLWGTLDTLVTLRLVTVKEMFLLDEYYKEKKTALRASLKKEEAA